MFLSWWVMIPIGGFLSLLVFGIFSHFLYNQTTFERDVLLILEEGDSFRKVEDAVIRGTGGSAGLYFAWAARVRGIDSTLSVGMYNLKKGLSLPDILTMLANKEVIRFPLTLVEGISLEEAISQIDNLPYLRGNLRGNTRKKIKALLPETYILTGLEHKTAVVSRIEKELNKVLLAAWRSRKKELPLKNKEELLVLASLVEKEAVLDEERALIAGVFMNRLRQKTYLQSDPSVIYARNILLGNSKRPLSKADLKLDSPYNTYVYKGLPPAPVALAGKKSIAAAANPVDTELFYFVADGNGGHRFAKTLEEHNKNVALLRDHEKTSHTNKDWRRVR